MENGKNKKQKSLWCVCVHAEGSRKEREIWEIVRI